MYSLTWKNLRQSRPTEGKTVLVHARQWGAREVHHTGEGHVPSMPTVVMCAAGTSEPFAVEIGLHQGSAFSPFLFAIIMGSLTENIRKSTLAGDVYADDGVLCAREKDVLELELEQWREALEKRGMKVSRAQT